jgi:hypothetical protein
MLLVFAALWLSLTRQAPDGGAADEALERSLGAVEEALGAPVAEFEAALQAGAAKVEIAPPIDWQMPMAANRTLKFTRAQGKRPESVWARAVALRQGPRAALIVSADILVISPQLADRVLAAIRQHVPIESDQLMLVAAHTHSGPGGYWEGGLSEKSVGPFQERLLDFLVERLARAAIEAWQGVEEVAVSTARIDVEFTIKNRAWVPGPENPFLSLVRFDPVNGGRPILLANYSAHSTNLLRGNDLLSGDYPALVADLVEESGGFLAFLPGTIGDQKPSFFRIRDAPRKVRLMAEYLMREGIVKAVFQSVEFPVLESFEFEVDLPPLQPRLLRTGMFGFVFARPWLVRRVMPPDLEQATVQVIRIGSIALIGAPADLATSVGLPLLEEAWKLGLQASFVSMTDDWIGYVLTEDEYHHEDYKTRSQLHGPRAGPIFASVYTRLIDALWRRDQLNPR